MRQSRPRWPLVAAVIVAAVLRLHAAFPSPQGPINDFAHVLDAATAGELATLVAGVRDKTTAEIAVVTVPSLDGMTVEEYANKLFTAWGIGKKGKDNGVLVLVAPTERKIHIEVGYGLEPVLPDGLAGAIIRTDFLPAFKASDYKGGILRGTRRIAEVVERNLTLSPAERQALGVRGRPPVWFILPFAGVWIAGFMFLCAVGLRTRTVAAAIVGGLMGGLMLLLSFVDVLNATPLVLVPVAILTFVAGWRMGGKPGWRERMRGTRYAASRGWAFSDQESPRGGSSSGGGSSGGSSFGGGSSGGGGASGSW